MPDQQVVNQLVNLHIKEVSGVGAAANMRKFLIVKSATPGNTLTDKLKNIVKQYLPDKPEGAMTFTQAFAYETLESQLSDMMYDAQWALRDTIKSIMKDTTIADKNAAISQALGEFTTVVSSTFQAALTAIGTPASIVPVAPVTKSKEGNAMPFKFTEEVLKGLPEDVRKGIQELIVQAGQVDTLTQRVADLEKSQKPAGQEEDIYKGMTPQARQLMEDLKKQAQDAQDIAKAEKNARITKEFIVKAATMPLIGITSEQMGPILKAVSEACPTEYAQLEAVLKANSEAIAKGDLFKTLGSDGSGATETAWDQINKKAEELRKADSSLTAAAALTKAMQENPALYAQYKREQAGA